MIFCCYQRLLCQCIVARSYLVGECKSGQSSRKLQDNSIPRGPSVRKRRRHSIVPRLCASSSFMSYPNKGSAGLSLVLSAVHFSNPQRCLHHRLVWPVAPSDSMGLLFGAFIVRLRPDLDSCHFCIIFHVDSAVIFRAHKHE